MLGTNVCGRALMSTLLLKRSILDLERRIYINDRRRWFLIGMGSNGLRRVLVGKEVEVAAVYGRLVGRSRLTDTHR